MPLLCLHQSVDAFSSHFYHSAGKIAFTCSHQSRMILACDPRKHFCSLKKNAFSNQSLPLLVMGIFFSAAHQFMLQNNRKGARVNIGWLLIFYWKKTFSRSPGGNMTFRHWPWYWRDIPNRHLFSNSVLFFICINYASIGGKVVSTFLIRLFSMMKNTWFTRPCLYFIHASRLLLYFLKII